MAKLILNPTSSSRREVPLGRTLVSIGRDPSNDVVLPDALVSRRHAVIEYRGDQYYLRDCNSSNGSLVNGDRVSEHPLKDGDLLAIGTSRFLFRGTVEVENLGAKVVAHPSSPRFQCPSCHADYRRGDLFCRHCGKGLPPPPPLHVTCPSCDVEVPLPAKFCTACGTALPPVEGVEPTRPRPIPQQAGDVVIPAAAPDVSPASSGSGAKADPVPDIEMRSLPAPAAGGAQAALSKPPLARPRPAPPTPAPLAAARFVEPAVHAVPVTQRPAGFAPRLLAFVVDTTLVSAVQAALVAPAVYYFYRDPRASASEPAFLPILLSVTLVVVAVVLGTGYYVYGWGVRGATVGKRLVGLAVQGTDGTVPIGVARALLRLLGYVLSGALLGVGFLMIAVGGYGLHDRLASTRVVRTGEGSVTPAPHEPSLLGEGPIQTSPDGALVVDAAPQPRAGSPWRILWELLHDVSIAVLFCFFLVTFVVQAFRVQGTSMQPLLEDGERIVVNKLLYRFEPIARGDVVVFWYPRDPSVSFIKRVVGLPGDVLELREGFLYVNGKPLDEPYLSGKESFRDLSTMPPTEVKPGFYFVLGDHRGSSNDSRNWGEVPEKYIYGKAVLRFWPFAAAGLIH